jgi:uncharacterized membrane protein YkvA (DUF1232 family)
LFDVIRESGQSYEQFGKRIGLSGMTLRRWRSCDRSENVPDCYHRAIGAGVRQLLQESRISAKTPFVKKLLHHESENGLVNTMKHLGMNLSALDSGKKSKGHNEHLILDGLAQIGTDEDKRREVDRESTKILSFKKIGREWSRRITLLWKVVRSKDIDILGKIVAYGALFYLVEPFDFIPDHLVGFGYIDDYVILGIAAVYCQKYLKTFSLPASESFAGS